MLPKCMAIRHGSCYLRSVHDGINGVVVELVDGGSGGANNPRCRFYLEASKEHDNDGGLTHVRCCHNKYWVPRQRGQDDGWIIGTADEPEEDLSKPSCTLFKLLILPATEHEERSIRFLHCKLGKCLVSPGSEIPRRRYLHVAHGETEVIDAFTFLDLSQQKKLPTYLAFKGDNGKYLRVLRISEAYHGMASAAVKDYLQFGSKDIRDSEVVHTSFTNDDGVVRIKSNDVDKFWRRDVSWIHPDSDDNTFNNRDTLFEVIASDDTDEAGDNFIILQNQGNKMFCKRLPTDGAFFTSMAKISDGLTASDDSITLSARLQVEEPVRSRLIYDVKFHLGEARVYTKEVVSMDTRTAINNSTSTDTIKFTFTVTETVTSTWNCSVSVKAGTKTTFKTGIPKIVDGKVEVSAETLVQ